MTFINESGSVGIIVTYMTNNITGSLFLTMMMAVIVLICICFLFRLPIELSAIVVLPMLLVIMTEVGDFLAVGGVFLIYAGILFAKNLWLK